MSVRQRRRYRFGADIFESASQQQAPLTTVTAEPPPQQVPSRLVSGRQPRSLALLAGTFILALVVVSIISAAIPTSTPEPDERGKRFSQWTNILFVWPVLSALLVRAYAVASVVSVTFLASVLHHGCLGVAECRSALADETFIIAGIGLTVIIIASGIALAHHHGTCCALVWVVALVALTCTLTGIAIANAPARIDGCLLIDGTNAEKHELVRVWSIVDDATAVTAIVVAFADFFREPSSSALPLGAIYAIALLTVALSFYQTYGLVSGTTVSVIVGLAIVAFVVWQLVRWFASKRATRRTHSYLELAGAALLGVAGLLIFFLDNTTSAHGFWHVLAAAALLLIIDASPPPSTISDVDARLL